jgi:hypothetical protein
MFIFFDDMSIVHRSHWNAKTPNMRHMGVELFRVSYRKIRA